MRRSPSQLAALRPPQQAGGPPLNLVGRLLGTRPSRTTLREIERLMIRGHAEDIATMLGRAVTSPHRLIKVLELLDTLGRRDEARRTVRAAKGAARARTGRPVSAG